MAIMNALTNVPLKDYTTMQLGGPARFIVEVTTPEEVRATVLKAKENHLPLFVMGGGSNIIARDEGFNGIILLNRIPGFTVLNDDGAIATIKIGAGENWDATVARTVDMGLSGIETMSAIPGTVGATPVQNVGAYGQEISNTLRSLEAYDIAEDRFVSLSNEDCNFSYRNSIFKATMDRRYIILSLTLELHYAAPQPPFYASLQTYLDENNITYYSPQVIRDAVIEVRRSKLPNPTLMPNTGSFFKNPIIEQWQLEELEKTYGGKVPQFKMADGRYKVPAGWLIEQAELKGYANHGMKTFEKNALVLVNETATSYADLAAFREEIINKVRDQFRITLEQEPEEL